MKPSTAKCLALLRSRESVTTHDFLVEGCGSRFGARLAELRHEHGCVIHEERLKGGMSGSRYTLVAELSAVTSPALADEPPTTMEIVALGSTRNPAAAQLSLLDGLAA